MARVLAISSYVASGHVGLAATVPALQALGHEVIAVPSVVLSCHYGHEHVGEVPVQTDSLGAMIDALAANGTLDDIDAVLTGYLPSADAVKTVAEKLAALANVRSEIVYLCDPVLGDDPDGLYVPEDVAAAIRDHLVPLADVLTPNRFELAWLSGEIVDDPRQADDACDATGVEIVAVTSVPDGDGGIANLLSTDHEATRVTSRRLGGVPHGTGDLFAALLLGHLLAGFPSTEAMARASSGVALVVDQSVGAQELALVPSLAAAASAAPAASIPLD